MQINKLYILMLLFILAVPSVISTCLLSQAFYCFGVKKRLGAPQMRLYSATGFILYFSGNIYFRQFATNFATTKRKMKKMSRLEFSSFMFFFSPLSPSTGEYLHYHLNVLFVKKKIKYLPNFFFFFNLAGFTQVSFFFGKNTKTCMATPAVVRNIPLCQVCSQVSVVD